MKKNPAINMLRVYFKERRVNTVPPEVKKFCLINEGQMTFGVPTKSDIERQNIVIVTLTTSMLLTNLGLYGFFTHIFVDEAAQALEAETIMPLAMATQKTCVVLAGDHKQISPKVYSTEACNQKFDISLLQRLFQFYDSHSGI